MENKFTKEEWDMIFKTKSIPNKARAERLLIKFYQTRIEIIFSIDEEQPFETAPELTLEEYLALPKNQGN